MFVKFEAMVLEIVFASRSRLAVNRQGNVASTCMLLLACKTIKHVETFRTTCDIC